MHLRHLILLLTLCQAGCGQTGPLYLPEQQEAPPPAPATAPAGDQAQEPRT